MNRIEAIKAQLGREMDGGQVCLILDRARLTQKDAAGLFNCHVNTIAGWQKKGVSGPSAAALRLLVLAMDLKL